MAKENKGRIYVTKNFNYLNLKKGVIFRGYELATDDPKVQKFVESHPLYGSEIGRADMRTRAAKKEEPPEEPKAPEGPEPPKEPEPEKVEDKTVLTETATKKKSGRAQKTGN